MLKLKTIVTIITFFVIGGLFFTNTPLVEADSLGTIHSYTVSTQTNTDPEGITQGPDGNMWFTESNNPANAIGKITPSGQITSYPLGSGDPNAYPSDIISGPDNKLWFTAPGMASYPYSYSIASMTTNGTPFFYRIATYVQPGGIASLGAYVWFDDYNTNQVFKMDDHGNVTPYILNNSTARPYFMASDPVHQEIWVGERNQGSTGWISKFSAVTGAETDYSLPSGLNGIDTLTPGPDGNMYFTSGSLSGDFYVGYVTDSGTFKTADVGYHNVLETIRAGVDGNLWATQYNGGEIAKITPGTLAVGYYGSGLSNPIGIASGSDGNMWFTEFSGNKVDKIGEGSDSSASYLAMGDSYASGEGTGGFILGTDENPDNMCHLSPYSYPYLMAQALDIGGSNFHSVTCSGAKTINVDTSVYGSQRQHPTIPADNSMGNWLPGQKVQENYISSSYEPNTITLSEGGDDVGFSGIVKKCVAEGGDCYTHYNDRLMLAAGINDEFNNWVTMYSDLRAESSSPKVYVTGYPSIVNPNATNSQCGANTLTLGTSSNNRQFADTLVKYLNYVIQQAAAKAGVQYVNTQDALDGHRLCETAGSDTAINGYTQGSDNKVLGIIPISNGSFHPNITGQRLLQISVLQQTHEFTDANPSPNSSIPAPQITDTDSQLTNFLKAPYNTGGTTANTYESDPTMTGGEPDGYYKAMYYVNHPVQVVISGLHLDALKPLSTFDLTINSDPIDLGNVTTDANGNINATVNIPSTVAPGFHVIDATGPDNNGQTVDVQSDPIFVVSSPTDYLGDGTPNSSKTCLFVPQSGTDANGDGVDDACKAYLGNTPTTTASLSSSPDSSGNYSNPVTVTLSATASTGQTVANTYYQIDGDSTQAYSTPFTVSGYGSHTINYWSVDDVGSIEVMRTKTFSVGSSFSDGFETGDFSNWDGHSSTQPAICDGTTSTTCAPYDGVEAALFSPNSTTGGETLTKNLDTNYPTADAKGYFSLNSASTNATFFNFDTSIGTPIFHVYYDHSTGEVGVQTDVGTPTTYPGCNNALSTSLPWGLYHSIEARAVIASSGNSIVQLWVDNQPVTLAGADGTCGTSDDTASLSVSIGNSNVGEVLLGDPSSTSNFQYVADDISIQGSDAGTVTGTVTKLDGTTPISGAPVYLNGGYGTITDENGNYTLTEIPTGQNQTIDVTPTGYVKNTATVNLSANGSTTQNISLKKILFSDGFETGDFSNWTTNNGVTACTNTVTGCPHTGTYAAESTASGATTAYVEKTLSSTAPEVYARAYVYIKSQGASNTSLVQVVDGSGNPIAHVFLNSSGQLGVYNDLTATATQSTATVSSGAWHSIEFHVKINGTSSSTDVYLDGTVVAALSNTSADLGTNNVGTILVGDNQAGDIYDVLYDDVQVQDGYVGP